MKASPQPRLQGRSIPGTGGAGALAAPGEAWKIMAEVITHFAFYPVRRFFFVVFFLIGCQIQRFQRRTKSVRSAVAICLCKHVLFIFSLLCGNSEDLKFPQLFLLRCVLCRVLALLRLPAASVRRLSGAPPPASKPTSAA